MAVTVSNDGGLTFETEIGTDKLLQQVQVARKHIRGVSDEAVEGIKREAAAREQQIGAIERVRQRIEALKKSQATATATQLPGINKDIQAYSAELTRLKQIGTTSFEAQFKEGSKFVSILDRMNQAAALYRKGMQEATNTENIVKYNRKLQELNNEISRLSNAGKRGFDEMGRPIKEQEGLIQRLERQVRLYKKGVQEATNTANIEKYNQKLRESQAELAKLSAIGVAASAKEQLGTQQKLQRLAEIYKTGAASATNPELIAKYNRKLQDTEIQLTRVVNVGKAGFDALGNKIQGSTNLAGKLWGGLKTVANILPGLGIAGLLAFAIDPIMNYIKGLDLFKKKTDEAVAAKKRLGDVTLTGNQNAQAEITTLRTLYQITQDTTVSIKKRKAAVDQLQRDYPKYLGNFKDEEILAGKASGAYSRLAESILATARARAAMDVITENSKKQLEIERQMAEAQTKQLTLFEKRNKLEKQAVAAKGTSAREGIRQDVQSATVANEQAIKENKKQQTKLEADRNKLQQENLNLAKNINQEVKKGAELTVDEVEKKKKVLDFESQREALLKRINALNSEFSLKPLQTADAEAAAIRRKFELLANEVAKFNEKNPKKAIEQVELQKLEVVRDVLIKDLRYKEETELIKIELEKQKQLYADFENYRDQVSAAGAQERYGAELDKARETAARVKEELAKLESLNPKDLTKSQQDRKEFLSKAAADEKRAEEAKYVALLAGLKNYEQQRLSLVEQYKRDRDALLLAGNLTEIEELGRKHKQDLDNLDDANAAKLAEFRNLFEGVDKLSIKAGKAVIEVAKAKLNDLVKQGKISAEMAKKVQEALDSASVSLKQRLPQQLGALATQLGNIATTVAGIDSGFAKIMQTTAGVIGNVSAIQTNLQAISKIKLEEAGIEGLLGAFSGGLGAIGAFFTIVKGIEALFDKSEEYAQKERIAAERKEAMEQARIKQLQSMTELLDRQLAAVKDIYGVKRLTEYRRVLTSVTAEYQRQLPAVENLLRRFGATRTGPDTSELIASLRDINNNSLAIEKLQQLLATFDPASEAAAQINALLSVAETYRETFNAIRAEATGTSFQSLTDEIVELFARGNAAAEDFAENFEKLMQKSVLNSFKRAALEKELQQFYEEFADLAESDGSLDKEEIKKLKEEYDRIIANAQKQFEELGKVTGVTFGGQNGADDQRGLAGKIKGISAEQADLLAGQFGAMRLAQLETLSINRLQLEEVVSWGAQMERVAEFNQRMLENSMAALQQREQIIVNTGRTVDRLDTTLEEMKKTNGELSSQTRHLRSIDSTSKSQYDGLRANGFV